MPIIEVKDLRKTFQTPQGRVLTAVDGVSFDVEAGECLGIIGESGSGKSTLGRLLLRLHEADSGSILLDGQDVRALAPRALRRKRRHWQIVFQEPFASLNPRLTVRQIVEEPLVVSKLCASRAERLEKVERTLDEVGLSAQFLDRRPANLSGGQQQRVGIARSLVTDPSIVVLDEPTSSLDLTIRASILRKLSELQRARGLTYVFISHDIETVRHFCSKVAVMHRGRFVETGPALDVLDNPMQAYTQALMAAAMPALPYIPPDISPDDDGAFASAGDGSGPLLPTTQEANA
ncbi:dipeptide/oligopeptide/nickel ABC transporter ATP-binding protein [Sinomonas sp. ASV322]|uniref:ABC transporter ATP-binding protein n=1 Tax=Sinomonas sp. ASV322 TaxID=3041920 RepID=UPI0027DAC6EF|nr:dipeptide/oligopeptide/nickel ABC transporter ATP-binding protein [Sinomonas sp. ASV322]MDQ4503550.1 dipeptide/oligopeptide/nickel ABC transporter ATP-binding protein [Sinomonas sp. ASV322]